MIRRSFRIGLWLGLVAGIAVALSKLLRTRSAPSTLDLGARGGSTGSSPSAWPPLEAAIASPQPVEIPDPVVEPATDTAEPGLIIVGDEPLQTPPEDVRTTLSAEPPAAPTTPAPAAEVTKKVAPKKAAPKKAAPKKAAAKKTAPKKVLPPWVDPAGGICPQTHPVKAKLSSGIFQVAGNFAYDRTSPDRCYQSPEAAVADGLRAAKR